MQRDEEAIDLRGRKDEAREAHRREVGYVRNNVHWMDYTRYQASGWLIGSGHVEVACKSVVGQRLKCRGIRWSEAGADAVCHLRALFKCEAGQWDAFWANAAQKPTNTKDAHPSPLEYPFFI